jgi:hypothetical protein
MYHAWAVGVEPRGGRYWGPAIARRKRPALVCDFGGGDTRSLIAAMYQGPLAYAGGNDVTKERM